MRPFSGHGFLLLAYEKLHQADCLHQDEEHVEQLEGFWREIFLLKPEPTCFRQILDGLSPETLLEHQVRF